MGVNDGRKVSKVNVIVWSHLVYYPNIHLDQCRANFSDQTDKNMVVRTTVSRILSISKNEFKAYNYYILLC
jgi:hypothetical protein